ncbi:MAG: hypothetical protein Q7T51_04275 [Candidatus Moranbacteria bacterium]|nr:hypothetical protein [Candidatus Moranbacteria bacterium]
MKILITNNNLTKRTGSELYVREVAEELMRRGHTVAAYSTFVGALGEIMNQEGIQTVDDLAKLSWRPDIIHGQHHLDTMTALTYFPGVPVVYFCHGWRPWQETPPLHPRIMEYAIVDLLTLKKSIEEHHVPENDIRLVHNFVDLERFKQRESLPEKPKKALIFNNRAGENNYVSLVRKACDRAGIDLDVVGLATGNQTDKPEEVLVNYDLVFAVGRSAIEALAVGAAVVICNEHGIGPMVTADNVERLYNFNFGTSTMYAEVDSELIYEEINKYAAADSAELTKKIRSIVSIQKAVDEIEKIYAEVLKKYKNTKINPEDEAHATSEYLRKISITLKQKYYELSKLQ